MKARVYWLGLVLLCSACAAPSLRYKTEVNKLAAAGKFKEADALVVSKQKKMYANHDYALVYLDRAALLHDADDPVQSDRLLDLAQQRITDLYTKSVTASVGKILINDLTTPYYPAAYERALTCFYRAMNFLQRGDVIGAGVEARRAVFFLDHLRGSKKSGYNDDPFIQYVASLIFESLGQLSDARIARQNALNAYANLGGSLKVSAPEFHVPGNASEFGEVIIFHYNGRISLKKNQTTQIAWDRALTLISTERESRSGMDPQVANALDAGFLGHAITLAYPVLEPQTFLIASSAVQANGQLYHLQKVADFAAAARMDLDENLPGIWLRTITRAIAKQIAAEQARQAVKSATKDDSWGNLAGLALNIFGAATEKADTRQWFTLPAEVHMTRIFVAPGQQDIRLLLRDGYGNIVGEKVFEQVQVKKGGRVFLHFRTAY